MSQHNRYVLVLWADQFEEVPAAIFVTELRNAGLRVKVVGLTSRPSSGSHGLALTPDLTLDQALAQASQAICLIIPQTVQGLHRLNHEPRLQKFFDLAYYHGARLVIGAPGSPSPGEKVDLLPPAAQWMLYPEGEALLKFARVLADLLREA